MVDVNLVSLIFKQMLKSEQKQNESNKEIKQEVHNL